MAVAKILILLTFACAYVSGLKLVCYYTNWSQYRNGAAKFVPNNIDPNLCTHIIYAFAKLNGNKLAPFEWNDDDTEWSQGMYSKVMDLKKQNPKLKVLLAVGGWNMGSAPFTKMVATAAGRDEFCRTSVDFLKARKFDGLDLDWEYPAQRGSPAGDREKFSLLVQACRKIFGSSLLLTAAVAVGGESAVTSYDVPGIAPSFDFINVMSYDMRGVWDKVTGHHAPLYGFPNDPEKLKKLNIADCVNQWISMGAPAEKLILGIPTYARAFTLPQQATPDIGLTVSRAGEAGKHTREAGFLSYYEVCEKIAAGATTKRYAAQGNVMVMVSGTQWAGYDDETTIATKVAYLKSKGLGGAMIWALDLDDFSGTFCGAGRYPLLKAIANGLGKDTTSVVTPPPPQVTSPPKGTPAPEKGKVTPTTKAPPTGSAKPGDACPGREGERVPHPTDCTHYLWCVHEKFLDNTCAPGLRFDRNSRTCDWANKVEC